MSAFPITLQAFTGPCHDNDRLRQHVDAFRRAVQLGAIPLEEVELAAPLLLRSPHPESILRDLLVLLDSEGGRAILSNSNVLYVFVALAAQSPFAARILVRRPQQLQYLASTLAKGMTWPVEGMIQELREKIERACCDSEQSERKDCVWEQLRHFKRRESLRIFLHEVLGLVSVRQTTASIADLAQACLSVAVLESAHILGDESLVDDFCVLGMGKLGGRELNYSSDVDLIYVCADHLIDDPTRRDEIDALARDVTAAMDETTAHGYVFRMDLRLRPEGSVGALVYPAESMLEYYLSWGRTWERSALLKARPVAGNLSIGDALLQSMEPFLYRKYLDYSAIDELRSMKQKIEQNARLSDVAGMSTPQRGHDTSAPTRGQTSSPLKMRLKKKLAAAGAQRTRTGSSVKQETHTQTPTETQELVDSSALDADMLVSAHGWDVKIGAGGIREVEFFVQALQLVHCGLQPGLRVRNTLDALDRLLYAGLVTHDDHAALADAYDLFRRLEHRVQMENDRQGHRLPADTNEFEVLAARLSTDSVRLYDQVMKHRQSVSTMFSRLFNVTESAPEKPTVRAAMPTEIGLVLAANSAQLMEQTVTDALLRLGFSRPRQVAGQLQILREKAYGPFSSGAGLAGQELAAFLLESSASAPSSDQAFSYLSRLITRVGDHPGYFRMLHENPHATRLLVHAFGSSQLLASILLRDPEVFERLVAAGSAAITRGYDDMASELAQRLAGSNDPGRLLGRIRRFHQEETLRIALHEIAGACSIDDTVEQLSFLAQVVVKAVLKQVYLNLCQRVAEQQGAPIESFPSIEDLPFCVLAMGKLGGLEMGFGSDLDIVFIYECRDDVDFDHQFYTRLAQRLVRALSSASEDGKLYDIDTRLRPSGSQGTLVVSLDAFEDYHRQSADLWERQALIKARPITGCRKLRQKLVGLQQQFTFGRKLPEDAEVQLSAIRQRMHEEFANKLSNPKVFDIKMTRGAEVDIEFLTQYLQLRYGHGLHVASGLPATKTLALLLDHAVMTTVTSQNTLVALEKLAGLECVRTDLPALDFLQLQDDYRYFRRLEARLRMSDDQAKNELPTDPQTLRVLARRLRYQGSDAAEQLLSELKSRANRVYAQYQTVLYHNG